jgi:N4-gp56 family major capsid protein
MGGNTNIPYGDPQALRVQAAGLWAMNQQRSTVINNLAGKMPKQADAEKSIRLQTSKSYPIVRVRDLGKRTGDEVDFDLINPVGGTPVMGGSIVQGRGVGMSFSKDKLRVNQARFEIKAGDTMTQIRSPHELRSLGRALADDLMRRYTDQSCLVHMGGARGFQQNIEWAVPLSTAPDFDEVMINPVRAPSNNRHFISTGTAIEKFGVTAGEVNLATSDGFTIDVVDSMRQLLDSMPLPPQQVIFDGDDAAIDSPLRVMLVSPQQYSAFAVHPSFRAFQSSAMSRAASAKQHPLFKGDVGLWNGILITKMPRPIRFYAGNEIKYCASATSQVETSCVVPASFGATYAVDRAILLGGQALAEAFASHPDSDAPFFWKEEKTDYGDKLGMAVGTIRGMSKIRFLVDHGIQKEYTDYGVITLDTAVAIPPGEVPTV